MKASTGRRRIWPPTLARDTELWDTDELWELSPQQRKQVKKAMIWGRPLPPELAQAALAHAPKLQTQAWYGRFALTLAAVFAALTLASVLGGTTHWWVSLSYAVPAVCQLVVGGGWLRAVARAERAVRDGRWPGAA